MIHIEVTINNESTVDLYYPSEKIELLKIVTDKYNMKTLILNGSTMYENVFDIVIEVI